MTSIAPNQYVCGKCGAAYWRAREFVAHLEAEHSDDELVVEVASQPSEPAHRDV